MNAGGNDVKTILVIGDWFIDENWLLTRQSLYHSSAPGKIHYLAKHKGVYNKITNLCGAATLIEVLSSYFGRYSSHPESGKDCAKKNTTQFEFLGYGIWNPADNEIIKCTLCPHNTEKKLLTPYTLTRLAPIHADCTHTGEKCDYSVYLGNLAPDYNVSTNRVIRCYEGYGGGKPDQLNRIDWILDPPKELNYQKLEEDLRTHKNSVVAVVLEDHGAGVINERSIEKLLHHFRKKPDVRWFTRTKIDNPPWLGILKKKVKTLELVVSDFKVAGHKKKGRRWLHGRYLSHAALELLGEMTDEVTYKHRKPIRPDRRTAERAAVLLDDNTVIAMEGDRCYAISKPPGERQLINLGRTTVFFAALIAQRLSAEFLKIEPQKTPKFGNECYQALLCAYTWSEKASKKWDEEELYLYGDYAEALEELSHGSKVERIIESEKYEKLWEWWNDSAEHLGTVKRESDSGELEEVLQVWRGEGTLHKYICVGGPKRDAINDLVSEIARFDGEKEPQHPFGCLLSSPPGWGKSFLAKCLADHFKLEFLEFSIAQMSENRDLIECLATIASVQARTRKKTLVFIDEANAKIEGHSAIGLLLGPLWDGKFMKDGKTYRLMPGVWVFASTDKMEKEKNGKAPDFISRLNGPIIELDVTKGNHWASAIKAIRGGLQAIGDESVEAYRAALSRIHDSNEYITFEAVPEDERKTEQVYLMISLLNSKWGPISEVQKPVLQLFHDLLPLNGFRSLEFFAERFEGIQKGVVRVSNVPSTEDSVGIRRHIIVPPWWLEVEDEKIPLKEKVTKWCRVIEKKHSARHDFQKCKEYFDRLVLIETRIK